MVQYGYIYVDGYSSSKGYYIDNVPFYNQHNMGYPTGCEAVSATMVANYSGYNVSVATIIENTPTDLLGKRQETRSKEVTKEVLNEETGEIETKIEVEEETVWIGENPFEYFVGHPTKNYAQGSYGCYANPISIALNASGVPNTNISGTSIDTVFEYIKQGKPVIVWCKARAKDVKITDTWYYPDGSGSYDEIEYEHCAVLIGFDDDYVYLNDPSVGKGVSQPKSKFISIWHKLYSQAIVIN